MLLREIKSVFHQELQAHYPKTKIDSFFHSFVEEFLGLPRFALVMHPEFSLNDKEKEPFFQGLWRLKKQEPLQYILGKTDFMGLEFKVTPDVLIPRPETEELVNWIVNECHSNCCNVKVLDIGTGSGCIAIALAKELREATVHALDISTAALAVASENAINNGLKVDFLQADILDEDKVLERFGDASFDVIVSNPPYVRELEKEEMMANVLDFEPAEALFVPDSDPLRYYRAIVHFSRKSLSKNGHLYFEINQFLAKETEQLLLENGFGQVELRKDIFGNFRMLKAKF